MSKRRATRNPCPGPTSDAGGYLNSWGQGATPALGGTQPDWNSRSTVVVSSLSPPLGICNRGLYYHYYYHYSSPLRYSSGNWKSRSTRSPQAAAFVGR